MSKKNTGVEYELLTRDVFQAVINYDMPILKTLKIERNVILTGLTTKHQIDVYWEFEIGGSVYKAILQAKDWVNKVSQGEILKLKAIKDDLPDVSKAVFVTKKGYQSGAIECAKRNAIDLYILNKESRNELISSIELNIHAILPLKVLLCEPKWDIDWIKEHYPQIKEVGGSFLPKEIAVFSADDSYQGNFEKLLNVISSRYDGKFNEEVECSNVLDNSVFLELSDGNKYKVDDLHLKFVRPMVEQKTIIKDDTLPGFVLLGILNARKVRFSSDLKIIDRQIGGTKCEA